MAPNMVIDVAHYRFSVVWSVEDQEFVATVLEFPSLSWLAHSQELALSGLRELVGQVTLDLEASGEDIPQPLANRSYSGNLKVRVSPQKHRELAIKAAAEGVSLNRYLNEKLEAC